MSDAPSDRVRLTVLIDPIVRAYAASSARDGGVSQSEWVERAIRLAIARETSERAMAAALARAAELDSDWPSEP